MKTKIDIVSGFLGAGKTTFIKKLIAEKLKNEKVVVLENEFGRANIDGQVLKDSGVIVKDIIAGCICCSLSLSFEYAIDEILKSNKPDRIIIEPSGIALLNQVIKSVTSNRYSDFIELDTVMTIVDVKRFDLSYSYSKEFLKNQIKSTPNIILSKIDRLDDKKIIEVVSKIHEINNNAVVVSLPWDKITPCELKNFIRYKQVEKAVIKNQAAKLVLERQRPKIEACEIETKANFNKKVIEDIFLELSDADKYGNIIRSKGIVLWTESMGLKFDYVQGNLTFESFKADGPGKICIIGINIDKNKINSLFERFKDL